MAAPSSPERRQDESRGEMDTTQADALYRFEVESQREAESILENVMRRQRWSIEVRDELALRLRIYANRRYAELTSNRRKDE